MQHRDWIEKAQRMAEVEKRRALKALSLEIEVKEDSVILFNPTMFSRQELLTVSLPDQSVRFLSPEVPSFGYVRIPLNSLKAVAWQETVLEEAPVIENDFYRISFSANGSISSIYDKELQRELLKQQERFHANEFVYTNDNHQTFYTPAAAAFVLKQNELEEIVVSTAVETISGAKIVQTVSLPAHEKRIDIDNQLYHVKDQINRNRYFRYGYYAFPFAVENAERRVALNGCTASPCKDQTGHGTETYLAGREWACVENGQYGIALLQMDSPLIEFERIHPDKTDYGMKETGSEIFSYLFNDWLQMHTPGGSHVNPRFRYSIISYSGNHKDAGIPLIAERMSNPLSFVISDRHAGTLPEKKSFLSCEQTNFRFLALKRSEDGNGVIARFWERNGETTAIPAIHFGFPVLPHTAWNTVDERPVDTSPSVCPPFGYLTQRWEGKPYSLVEASSPLRTATGIPAPIGSIYTGLITEPCAACGEDRGHLYLIWGQNMESDLSHYELYRSEKRAFEPGPQTFLSKVEPGSYRVALFEEKGLADHTTYYYRVRAVNKSGIAGEFSREFEGVTREV